VKEVKDENALKHMFDKAHLKRTADALVAAYPLGALTNEVDQRIGEGDLRIHAT
jgi:hypothetical protein